MRVHRLTQKINGPATTFHSAKAVTTWVKLSFILLGTNGVGTWKGPIRFKKRANDVKTTLHVTGSRNPRNRKHYQVAFCRQAAKRSDKPVDKPRIKGNIANLDVRNQIFVKSGLGIHQSASNAGPRPLQLGASGFSF